MGRLNVERRSQSLEMVEGKRREGEDDQVFHSQIFQGTEQGADFEISMKTILMRLFVGRGVNFDQSDR